MTRLRQVFMPAMYCLVMAAVLAGCGGGDATAIDGHSKALTFASQPAPPDVQPDGAVGLGTAGNFAILSKSGVTDVYASAVTGDVGSSPITGAAVLLSCDEVTGTIYTVNAAGPLCAVNDATRLTAAVGDMETAYDAAAGRTPGFTELGAGDISGMTLAPGVYKWGTGLLMTSDVTLHGGPSDVWIFQIAGTLTQASDKKVVLTGGALPQNVFWQVADVVAIGTGAHMEGVVLAKTMVAMKTGATIKGRLLAQTAVTLQMNTVTQPAP